MTDILEAHGLSKGFGGLTIISDVSVRIPAGDRRLVLGPNGAGKTTLLNLLAGELFPGAGHIVFEGRRIERLSSMRRARLGIGRTFQVLTLFEHNTVLDNVVLAALGHSPGRWNPFRAFHDLTSEQARAKSILDMVDLGRLANRRVSDCAYGEKRRLEIALVLAQRPKLLLLDEPFAGLSAAERRHMLAVITAIPPELSIVMVEHDMELALQFARHVTIMQSGRIVVEGQKEAVVADPKAREVYLGH